MKRAGTARAGSTVTSLASDSSANGGSGDQRYRYERKFVAEADRSFVESVVRYHPALFRPIFHSRWINNIYLDTLALESYEDNVAGSSCERIKVRIRWYGDLLGVVDNPVLELKIKHNIVNRKESFALGPFKMTDRLSTRDIRQLFRQADLPEGLRHDLCKLEPTLLNRYRRTYYRTPDRAFRITIDSDLAFHAMKSSGTVESTRWCAGDYSILELKYPQDAATRGHEITQHLPFRLSRSSKYVSGIERTRYRFGFGDAGVRILAR